MRFTTWMLAACLPLASASPAKAAKRCSLPKSSSEPFETAFPEEVGLDSAAVAAAVLYANTHNRLSIQIFRHNCLVATGLLDPVTDDVPNQVWSVTKSVVSMLTGIAMDRGMLGLHDRIDKYLPNKPGWGNAKHRNLTVFQLLTEVAGMRESILAEGSGVMLEPSAPQQALAQPFQHPPGTYFEYSQRVPDLLAYVVSRAVKQDLQDFAQANLFGPLGIKRNEYVWLRDRSGNTYGYAWLFLSPKNLARLGHLALGFGKYAGKRIVPDSHLRKASTPSQHNPCYGWLFWNNAGSPCTGANIPSAQTLDRRAIPAAPHDLYAMVGALQQNNFIIPSLDMLVTWTGAFGDLMPNLGAILSASPADLYNNFFSLLMKAVKDADVPKRGFLGPDPLDLDIDPRNYIDPAVIISNYLVSPQCNVLFCNGGIPTKGLLENLQEIANIL